MFRLLKPLFLVAAVINLLVGMFSGLARLGWAVPLPEAYAHHGAIMVGGFLGTLIALEKIIPLKKPIFYLGPMLSALSVVFFLNDGFYEAVVMQILAGLFFVLAYGVYLRAQKSLPLFLAAIGAAAWVVASGLLLWKQFYPMVFPWYMAFLLFTIVSERLEQSRFLPVTPRQHGYLVGFLGLFFVGLVIPFHTWGRYAAGFALIGVSTWLLRYDLIRITLKKEGLVRFTAIALLCGYVMLMLDGVFLIVLTDQPSAYDMLLHTFFLGFVFSMIFAHGPIILPGVLGLSVKPYSRWFYVPLFILLFSLLIRLLAGATILPMEEQAHSGRVTMGAILFYFVLMITFTIRAVRQTRS